MYGMTLYLLLWGHRKRFDRFLGRNQSISVLGSFVSLVINRSRPCHGILTIHYRYIHPPMTHVLDGRTDMNG